MKKVITILMLVLLLYNSVGYYIVYQIHHAFLEREISESIQAGLYSEEDLKVFKIPVDDYYNQEATDFNRVDGDFKFNGKFYERVKEKLENDTLYVYCLNNDKEDQLLAELSDHVYQHLVDGKTHKQSKNEKSFKDLLKEYLPKSSNAFIFINEIYLVQKRNTDFQLTLFSLIISIPTPPPELA